MDMKEKLVELIQHEVVPYFSERIADRLIAHGVTVQEWISVKDRMPERRDGKVLAFTHFGFSICHVRADGRLSGLYADWITHWMPLPEPPNEG